MRFFFYGTLIAGSGNAIEAEVHRKLRPVCAGSVRGRLYAIPDREGWYPALLRGAGSVRGMIYQTAPGFVPADLARLDAYEGIDRSRAGSSLYLRRPVRLICGESRGLVADAYLFNGSLPSGARRIDSGDFHAWLAANRFTAYRAR
jgi:gamma-glutamylcyclotransferase (GGCT)/AIG2-like uncharacterized protein YtfP